MRSLRAEGFGLTMGKRIATMGHTRHLILALLSWTGCLVSGELAAQQVAPRSEFRTSQAPMSRRVINSNARSTSKSPHWPSQSVFTRKVTPAPPVAFHITVIGAVKFPTVFETTDKSVPLRMLIEQSGGETADSIGTFCMMEQGQTRSLVTLRNHLDLEVAPGQVVFVTPRGGKSSSAVDLRQPHPEKLILITGMGNEPFLFNIGYQTWTLEDLLLALGQSPALVESKDVIAVQPQGSKLELESSLSHNTVIHFQPGVANLDGIPIAQGNGFQYQKPVKLPSINSSTSSLSPPTYRVTPVPSPEPPPTTTSNVPESGGPLIIPLDLPLRDETQTGDNSEIEPAGSSLQTREPLLFPTEETWKGNAEPSLPHSKPDGRAPRMLPRSWKKAEEHETEAEDPARTINRTSAGQQRQSHQIVTASAEFEGVESTLSQPSKPPTHQAASSPESSGPRASSITEPPSWPILLLVLGVAASSVIVTRVLSRPVVIPPEPMKTADEVAQSNEITQDAVAEVEEEQRFLERLILNKIPVIEEEAELPQVDRLHGMAVGARRLVVHEAHDELTGPHFKVREPRDTREVELKLRKLMRTSRQSTEHSGELTHSSEVRETRSSPVGPLERALRTVERGVTQ